MDKNRLIVALALSLLVLVSWPVMMRYLAPSPPLLAPSPPPFDEPLPAEETAPSPPPATGPQVSITPPRSATPATPQTQLPPTQVPVREITIDTVYWRATLSNRGAVATSWILKKYKENGEVREVVGADGKELQLIPQEIPEYLTAPLGWRTPWSPELASVLNRVNFQIDGVSEDHITLGEDDHRKITFKYVSPTVTAYKSLTFYGGRFVVDVTAEVKSSAGEQPVEIILGPRIGDQSDRQTGSYSTPPQVVAYTREAQRQQILGSHITPSFATIVEVKQDLKQIDIDKPLAGDVSEIKITADKGATFIGYARVVNREANGQRLTLDSLPPGTSKGESVAQAVDTLRNLYRWAGVTDHYFAMLAVPDQPITEISVTNLQARAGHDELLDYPSLAVPVSATPTHIFVGPKDRELLAAVGNDLNANLGALIDYGMFSFAVRPLIPALAWALNGLRKTFGNYGWAIVAVTVMINLALSPLRFYSSKKMKKAAKHQPRMKELQDKMKKLKENPKKYERELQQLQQEQLALMKEANPLGGCLPLILQLPIFWTVYLYLGSSLDVRHEPWILWIGDLSRPDPYKILPIVMCITMILSTKLTPQPASADPQMKMQRVMMTWLMPIMLTWFFFFSAPSGLVLYWMVSNAVGVLIQLWINRRTAELTAEAPAGTAGGAGAGKSASRAVERPVQKGAKVKGGKKKQQRRSGAEAEASDVA